MADLLLGAGTATAFLLLVRHARRRQLELSWWHWALTVAGFVYAIFVAEVVLSLLAEGTVKGATVMGSLLGPVAVVWGVLLHRFVFRGRRNGV
jgi:drug/metabolite transporter (DMT)-like permease